MASFQKRGFFHKSKDFYVNDQFRYAYVKIDSLKMTQIASLSRGFLVFAKDEAALTSCTEEDLFDHFYTNGFLLAEFLDFYIEGNSLTFLAQNPRTLNKINRIATMEGFA